MEFFYFVEWGKIFGNHGYFRIDLQIESHHKSLPTLRKNSSQQFHNCIRDLTKISNIPRWCYYVFRKWWVTDKAVRQTTKKYNNKFNNVCASWIEEWEYAATKSRRSKQTEDSDFEREHVGIIYMWKFNPSKWLNMYKASIKMAFYTCMRYIH